MDLNQVRQKITASPWSVEKITRTQLAGLIGVSENKARHIKDKLRGFSPVAPAKQSELGLVETRTETKDSLQFEIPRTRIQSLEELVEHFKVDLAIWSVKSWTANKWEVGAKQADGSIDVSPLYQVKAIFERKKFDTVEFARAELSRLMNEAKKAIKPFNINKVYRHESSKNQALEMSIYDIHLGKLAWSPETLGASYDLKIATKMGEEAFVDLIGRHDPRDIGKILLVLGQDMIHSDNIAGTTTRGTQVNSDGRWQKLFQAGFDFGRKQIETALQIAPVEVITCVGNHDTHISYSISHSLESLFSGNRSVSFDNSPAKRKYWYHGNTMLMFTHGDKEKKDDLPMIMATEKPELFGSSEYREAHTGHIHSVRTVEKFGVRVRTIPSLTPPDAWHSEMGYVNNIRAAQSFLWTEFDGLRAINEYNVKRMEE